MPEHVQPGLWDLPPVHHPGCQLPATHRGRYCVTAARETAAQVITRITHATEGDRHA